MGRFTATISGVSCSVLSGSLHISDVLNGRRSCSFDIFDRFRGAYGGHIPDSLVGKAVTVRNDGQLVFGGMIQDQSYRTIQNLQALPNLDLMLSFTCADYSVLADRHIVFWVFEAQTLAQIVTFLISQPGVGTESLATDGVNVTPVVVDVSGNPVSGPTIPRFIVDGFKTVAQAFDDLAKLTGYSWVIDYDLVVKFRQAGVAAPFTITNVSENFSDLKITTSLADYRNEQYLTRDISLVPPFIEDFAGDGVTRDWFLQQNVATTPSVLLRKSTNPQAILTLDSVPAEGETVTIDGRIYTYFANVGSPNQILISGTPQDCLRNLSYAINAAAGFEGLYFGAGTLIHPTCEALGAQGHTLTVRFRVAGDTGNGTVVSDALGDGSWSAGTLTGGAGDPGDDIEQTVGVIGQDLEGTFDWYWLIGTTKIARDGTLDPVPVDYYLEVTYRAMFSNVIVIRDQDAIDERSLEEGNSGLTSAVTTDTGPNTGSYAALVANGLLRRYGRLARSAELTTDDIQEPTANLLRAGMHVQVTRSDYNLNQQFLVEAIDHNDVEGRHMKYTCRLVGFADEVGEAQGSWVDFLAGAFTTGQQDSSVVLPSLQPPTPEISEFVSLNGMPVEY